MSENQEPKQKFYSQPAILIATFFGGPLAAGYLVKKNYDALGQPDYAKKSLIIGILVTILIMAILFAIPEDILDKIPSAIIPGIYTLIIYFIVEKLQGKQLKEHKENDGAFHSTWKAVGIGAICFVILIGVIFGYAYLSDSDVSTQYENQVAILGDNENKALELFEMIEYGQREELIQFIDSNGIPIWEENIKILGKMDEIDGISDQLIEQNKILRNYYNLRIEQYQLIREALIFNTEVDEIEMLRLMQKIEEEVAKLNP